MNSRNNTNGKNAMAGERGISVPLSSSANPAPSHERGPGGRPGFGSAPSCTGWPFLRGLGAGVPDVPPFPSRGWRRRAPRPVSGLTGGDYRESPTPRARVEELVFGENLSPAGYGEFSILPSRAAGQEKGGAPCSHGYGGVPQSCRRELQSGG